MADDIHLLSIGYPQAMVQNVVYALPSSGSIIRCTCDDTTATFQVSNDVAFVTSNSANLGTSGFDNGFAFIRVTNKAATINIRRWQA